MPDRNLTGSALWWDGAGTIYHFNGVGAGDHWRDLSMIMRKSTDNGVTWTRPRLIGPEHCSRHLVNDSFMRTATGTMVLACDATSEDQEGGTAVHISRNAGQNWYDPGIEQDPPSFKAGTSGGWIAGIHAGIVELHDGRWVTLGRGNNIEGCMPMSISGDEGRTWPHLKLITPGGPRRVLNAPCNRRWGERYSLLDRDRAESRGYLTAVQTGDGMIHLLSSGTHYRFNLAWLQAE